MKTDDSGPLLPRDWKALAPLVDRVLDAPPDRRAALLAELSAGDPLRRATLERLVAECQRDLPLLDRPAVERFDQLLGEEPALPLPAVLGGRYRIEREVGRGGMARVFLAQDLKHARQVAVKVIRPELAASLGRERFLREIGIAARLRHPNIMPLYDSGDADGVLYFVMPYEDGPSLRTRLEDGIGLPIAEAISILRDVARALAYAHEKGVVHRDIKPDNVMVSGGAAVVTDFGIAKAFSAAQTEAGGSTITQSGSIIGTPAYMAPEQGMGDPATDHRADLYSFGCLAYELLTGKAPFAGSTTFQIVAAQMAMTPKPVTESRADVPREVAQLIARCLEKDPAARPQSAQELVDLLGGVSTSGQTAMPRRRIPVRVSLLLAAVLILVVVAAYLFARKESPDEGRVTLAVLPLGSVGGDSDQALLAEGFGEDIATALVKVPWVRVISQRGAGNYRGQEEIDPRATGEALGVRYLVMGSLRNLDGRQTLTVQLVSSEDRSTLWAEQFDRPTDLAGLRDRVATTIGDSLKSHAGRAARTMVAVTPPAHHGSDEAYQLFLLGKRKLNQRGQNIGPSIALFREAIAMDTLSAEAYSGLSLALALAPLFQDVHADSVAEEATAAARRALLLDPSLPTPHIALGVVLESAFDWPRAESEFKRALTLDSHDVEARIQFGRYLLRLPNKIGEAISQFKSAQQDDPASAVVSSLLAHAWDRQGHLDSALTESARARRFDPENLTTVTFGSMTLLAAGRNREAIELIQSGPRNNPYTLYVFAVTGDTTEVLKRLAELQATRPKGSLAETATAAAYLGLGDTARALDALERATAAREIWFMAVPPGERVYNAVRGSVRFQALLIRVGLPTP